MTRSLQARVRLLAFRAAITLIVAECLSLLAIRLSRPLLNDEIRTSRDIFREQSEKIRRLLDPSSPHMLSLDATLGWRYRAGYRDSANAINTQGLRSTREYLPHPPSGVLRVAAFGDSFVYGNEVADSASWPALVEQLFPRVEVLNYGVGGYGVDQAYLRYCEEGTALSPSIVIIGFATDDLRRVVNVYRRFISNREIPLAKPRFILDARGRLVLLPNPLPHPSDYERFLLAPRDVVELGARDYWYQASIYRNPLYDYSATVRLLTNLWLRISERYFASDRLLRGGEFNTSSAAFRIQTALFEEFAVAVQMAGARPLVVILPDRESVAAARQGQRTIFDPLVTALAGRGIEHLDVTEAFRQAQGNPNSWFMIGGHYSPTGNRIVAQWLGRELLARAGAERSRDTLLHTRDTARGAQFPNCPARVDGTTN